MADIEQLSRAFMAADKAGDTKSAQLLANAIRELQAGQAQPEAPAPTAQTQAEAPDTSILGALGQGVDQSGAMVGKGIQSGGEIASNLGAEGIGDYLQTTGAEMAQRNEAQLAASNYQRPEGADGIIKNLKEGEFANAGNSLLYGAAEAAPQVAGGVVASVGAGLAATSAPILGTAAAIGGTIYGTVNALGQVRDEKEQQELDPTATGMDLATAVASGLVELLPIKGGGATLKVLREAGQEGVQESLVIGNTMVQGGEYVPQEVLERVGDAAITGGAIAKGVNMGISTVNKAGKVVLRPKEDLDPETTQAASDVSALLQRVADENGYNLKDIDATSSKGANKTLEGARSTLVAEVKGAVKELKKKGQYQALNSKDQAIFDEVIKQSNGKVAASVTKENFDFMQERFGNTNEGQTLLNTFRRSNILTEIYAGGLQGGVSKFTDLFNPLNNVGRGYNPARDVGGLLNIGAVASTGGSSLAAQIPLVAGGRAIDAVTGRRSKVSRFVKKNKGGNGLADPTAPAARDLTQEAKDRKAAEKALRNQPDPEAERQKAEVAQQKADDKRREFEAGQKQEFFDAEEAKRNAQQYAKGEPPLPKSPRGTVHSAIFETYGAQGRTVAELDTDIMKALDEVLSNPATDPERKRAIRAYKQSLATGKSILDGSPLNDVTSLIRSKTLNFESKKPKKGQKPLEPQLPLKQQLGKNSNQAYLATLRDKMDNDKSVLAEDRATLGDAFDTMALNLSKDPVADLEAIISRATSNLMKPKLAETYLSPYIERVKQQQKVKDAPSQPEPSPTGPDTPRVEPTPVDPVPAPPAGPVLQPAPEPVPPKPKPAPNPPKPKQIKKAQPEATAIIEIGKKGSKYENGIQDWDMALEAAKLLGLAVNIFDSNAKMNKASKEQGFGKVKQTTFGFYHTRGSKGGAGGTLFGIRPGGSFQGEKLTTVSALTTLMHEIAHGVTIGPLDGETSAYYQIPSYEHAPNKLAKLRGDRYRPGSFVASAIVPLLSGKDFDVNHPIVQEINNLQRNVTAALEDGSSEPVRYFSDLKNPESPNAKKYTKYATNFHEFAVDPVWVYMFDPALAKQVMPETTALIRKEFAKAGNKQIQFYGHPFATILAVVSAMGLLAAASDEEEEPMMAPGILSA